MSQQQKTDPLEDESLPELTPKQDRYVQARLAGKNKTDAVRLAVDVSKWSNNAVWVEGHRMENNAKVSLWMDVIRREQITAANYTHEVFLAELEELRQLSVASGNMGAAVNATVNKGKSAGHMIEKTEITNKTDKSELDQALEMLRGAGMHIDIPEMTKH